MRLMRYPKADFIDIVATHTEGAVASWLNHEQVAVETGVRHNWPTWAAFRDEMIRAFEPTTDDTLARQQMAILRQTGRVAGYIQNSGRSKGASRT